MGKAFGYDLAALLAFTRFWIFDIKHHKNIVRRFLPVGDIVPFDDRLLHTATTHQRLIVAAWHGGHVGCRHGHHYPVLLYAKLDLLHLWRHALACHLFFKFSFDIPFKTVSTRQQINHHTHEHQPKNNGGITVHKNQT